MTDGTTRPRPRVLFIEDNLTQLDLYAMLIEDDLSVVKASRALTAYELAVTERPDVILLDLLLPDLDGFALTERLRTNPVTASIPIVVLTGDDVAYSRASRDGRFSDVLLKPSGADKLIIAITQSLARVSTDLGLPLLEPCSGKHRWCASCSESVHAFPPWWGVGNCRRRLPTLGIQTPCHR